MISTIRPYRRLVEICARGEREGAEIGDHVWSSYLANEHARVLFVAGEPLAEVALQMERSIDGCLRVKYDELAAVQRTLALVVRRLRGLTSPDDPIALDDGESNWSGYSRCLSQLGQLQGLCVFGAYEDALELALAVMPYLASAQVVPFFAAFPFFHSLALAALYDEASASVRDEYLGRLRAHEQSYQGWATSCPENFSARHVLMRAEIARVTDRPLEAEELYEEAIARAHASGQVQIEAIANETAARFYRARSLPSIARMYLRAAQVAYARWGADGKVRELEQRHPELRDRVRPAFTSVAARPDQLDFMSVVKAAQTISGELQLDRLTSRLIEVILEQSGAEIGRLLLVHRGELRVECEARATEHGVETNRLPAQTGLVPEAITSYVWRTREKVILDDAREPDGRRRFRADEYIARNRPRSVLCLPIVRGSAPVGLIYLENNLASHAFTRERIAALDVIASQAAITLEIAFWIRQEHEARDALAGSEARFRRLSDANMIGIFFSDLSGRIIESNDYFLEMVGYTREDLAQGRILWTALTPPEHEEKDANAIRELDATGICRPFEKEYIRKDGSRVSILLGAALLEGSKTETATYVLDITERKRAEHERDRLLVQEQRARAAAEDAVHMRDDFLSITAHELRTPLTPLKMQIEVLALLAQQTIPAGSAGREQLLDMLERSNHQVDRLSQLMAELLDISRIGAGRLVLAVGSTDLSEVVGEVVKRFQSQLERASCEVEVTPAIDGRIVGEWDRERLEQVVMNLLTNAMKYGAGSLISIALGRDADAARLEIRDRGIGIDEEHQSRIFGRFERAVPVQNFGGFGLGLFVAQQIVVAHGGSISVDSRPGAGATFIVRLPLRSSMA